MGTTDFAISSLFKCMLVFILYILNVTVPLINNIICCKLTNLFQHA